MTSTARSETGKTRRSLRHDTSGLALIYVTVALPVIIGMALLAVDFGRLATLQSSLQAGADSLALASAAELDLRADAVERGNRAIDNLITQNKSIFATTVATISASEVERHFLDAIPDNDAVPIDAGWISGHEVLTDGTQARFVVVKVNPQRFDTIFPATFVGASSNTAQSSAEAVAGFQAAVCNFTPLFMCNPLEPVGNTDISADFGLESMINSYTTRRKVIRFLAVTGNSTTTGVPGQFGFLEITKGGANALSEQIASISPKECYIVKSLATKTGSMTGPMVRAFNTRFDDFGGGFSAADYPPAINVRKGFVPPNGANPNFCNASQGTAATNPGNTKVMGMPIDSCFSTNTCAAVSGNANIGNGDWGWDPDNTSTNVGLRTAGGKIGYWDLNFIGTSLNTATLPTPPDGGTYSNTKLPSRYDLYRYEISSGYYNRFSKTGTVVKGASGQETGLPKCAERSGAAGVDTTTGSVDRRIVYGAVINCYANDLHPGSNGTYRAFAFAKFFMIRPMVAAAGPGNPAYTLWTELVDLVYPGDADGVAKDIVQLYR